MTIQDDFLLLELMKSFNKFSFRNVIFNDENHRVVVFV